MAEIWRLVVRYEKKKKEKSESLRKWISEKILSSTPKTSAQFEKQLFVFHHKLIIHPHQSPNHLCHRVEENTFDKCAGGWTGGPVLYQCSLFGNFFLSKGRYGKTPKKKTILWHLSFFMSNKKNKSWLANQRLTITHTQSGRLPLRCFFLDFCWLFHLFNDLRSF